MKKLVLLTLVLSVASLANAALSLTVNGIGADTPDSQVNIDMDTVAQVGVWNDTFGPGAGQDNYLYIELGGQGGWTGDVGFPAPPGLGGSGGHLGLMDLGFGAVDLVNLNTGIASAADYDIGVISWADYLAGSSEVDVTITLLAQDFSVLDTITIHTVPEPVTMALLGLGGLFLRRRK